MLKASSSKTVSSQFGGQFEDKMATTSPYHIANLLDKVCIKKRGHEGVS